MLTISQIDFNPLQTNFNQTTDPAEAELGIAVPKLVLSIYFELVVYKNPTVN